MRRGGESESATPPFQFPQRSACENPTGPVCFLLDVPDLALELGSLRSFTLRSLLGIPTP